MDAATVAADLELEVQRLADELTPELLPRLMKRLLQRDALVHCERHDGLLYPYVRAQIALTRAKRNYYRYGDFFTPCDAGEKASHRTFILALTHRDEVRDLYRSKPCTCYVSHR